MTTREIGDWRLISLTPDELRQRTLRARAETVQRFKNSRPALLAAVVSTEADRLEAADDLERARLEEPDRVQGLEGYLFNLCRYAAAARSDLEYCDQVIEAGSVVADPARPWHCGACGHETRGDPDSCPMCRGEVRQE